VQTSRLLPQAMAGKAGQVQAAGTLEIWWPALFVMGTMVMMLILDASPEKMWPPTFDLSGSQAKRVLTSPAYLVVAVPMMAVLMWIPGFAKRNSVPGKEVASMVWWVTNAFWFHTGCDIFSGFFQFMPVYTELYKKMNPAHLKPRWHDARNHLDGCYALELILEAPFALWVFWLFIRRHPSRHIAEVLAASVQLAGTVVYYAPGLVKWEVACYLSWMDRACGFVWILFPAMLIRRHFVAMQPKKASKKA